jgi:MoaA/NifB/PqqE/SkfB family radical SAM enzyme
MQASIQPAPELLSRHLAALAGRLRGVDPQLTRVLVPWIVRHPRYIPGYVRLARSLARSERVRANLLREGVKVPPFLVLSVTTRCNLRCLGCYAAAAGTVAARPSQAGLDLQAWYAVVEEAARLGVFAFIVAGGEPFLLPGRSATESIVQLFRDHPDRLFLVFTNGTALRPADYDALCGCTNTVVVVSVEGDRNLTDHRRGPGVFDKALATLDRLREAGILTGMSVTVGAENADYWSNPRHIDGIMEHCGPLAMFIEQIPDAGCDMGSVLSDEQRSRLRSTVVEYRDRASGGALIIHSPGDEEALGGCVSAGKGFAHVTPAGDVTACPVSALATHNVRKSSLREALASPLFTAIRDNAHLLETAGHPCGLSAHARELEEMTRNLGAYRTGTHPAAHTGAPLVTIGELS